MVPQTGQGAERWMSRAGVPSKGGALTPEEDSPRLIGASN